MNYPKSVFLMYSLTTLLVATQLVSGEQKRPDRKTVDSEVQKLQRERVDLLQQALELLLVQYSEGGMDYHAIHFVQRELLEARLDVAETRQERAEQLASQLKIVKGSLAIAEARCIAGAVSKLDVHWARADVLHVRIQLLKLAETDESKIKSSHAQSLENRRVR